MLCVECTRGKALIYKDSTYAAPAASNIASASAASLSTIFLRKFVLLETIIIYRLSPVTAACRRHL